MDQNQKLKKQEENGNDNAFNINKKDYSIEIINKNNLNSSITEGEDKLDIEIIIKNNGFKQ